MQEHIRRAHPEHYISKLPATEESFNLMISTAPSERPQIHQNSATPSSHLGQSKGLSHTYNRDGSSAPTTPRTFEEYQGGSLFPAAAALAQLHNHKIEPGWDSEPVRLTFVFLSHFFFLFSILLFSFSSLSLTPLFFPPPLSFPLFSLLSPFIFSFPFLVNSAHLRTDHCKRTPRF